MDSKPNTVKQNTFSNYFTISSNGQCHNSQIKITVSGRSRGRGVIALEEVSGVPKVCRLVVWGHYVAGGPVSQKDALYQDRLLLQ